MQKYTKSSRVLAFILCFAMFVTMFPLQALAANDEIYLKNGTAKITADMTTEQVKEAIFGALVENPEGKDAQSIEWEYGCDGKNGLLVNWAYGSIEGFQSKKALTYYTHPAIKDIADGTYNVRLKGTENFVRLTKTAEDVTAPEKPEKQISLKDGQLVVKPEMTTEQIKAELFKALVVNPEGLDPQAIEWEYGCDGKNGLLVNWAYGSIEGFQSKKALTYYTHPALKDIVDGTYNIRIKGYDNFVRLTKVTEEPVVPEVPESNVVLKDGSAILSADMTSEQVKDILFKTLVANPAEVDAKAIEWEYGCDGKNGLLVNWAYGSVDGFTSKKALTEYAHPAIKDIADGTYNVRIKGSENFVRFTKESKQIPDAQIVINENIAPVELHLKDNLAVDYDRFATDLFKAVYNAEKSSPSNLTAKDVTFQYDASRLDTIPIWQNLDFVDKTNVQRPLSEGGTYKFKMTVAETADHHGVTVEFKADVKNATRIDSSIVFTKKTFTYTSDYNAMREAIFKSAIDWKASNLPNPSECGLENYTIEYYAENLIAGQPAGTKRWVPLEGGRFPILYYPAMGAGEHQIRIKFKGNSTHSAVVAEKTITVKKARTYVNVHSTSKYADEKFPANFVTTSAKDKLDIYTIYAGITSSTTAAFCVDLPDSITESFFITLLNPIVKLVIGKSMTEVINNGITLAEINAVVNSQALKDLIAKLNIDLGVAGTVLKILDKLPSSLQNITISFNEPNKAGFYNVVALAINPNYEVGVGFGVATVKMRYRQTALQFNQQFESRHLTVDQAKEFDFNATLSYQGVAVDQSSVHYLYSGFKRNGRVYSSTTEAPTEPGYYVQTVVILGGNYMAAPITRTFTIK